MGFELTDRKHEETDTASHLLVWHLSYSPEDSESHHSIDNDLSQENDVLNEVDANDENSDIKDQNNDLAEEKSTENDHTIDSYEIEVLE